MSVIPYGLTFIEVCKFDKTADSCKQKNVPCGKIKELDLYTRCCESDEQNNCFICSDTGELNGQQLNKCNSYDSDLETNCWSCPDKTEPCPVGSFNCCPSIEGDKCNYSNCCVMSNEGIDERTCCPSSQIRFNYKVTTESGSETINLCCPEESWIPATADQPGHCCKSSEPIANKTNRTCGKYCGSTKYCYTKDSTRTNNSCTSSADCDTTKGETCSNVICYTSSVDGTSPPEYCVETKNEETGEDVGMCLTKQCNPYNIKPPDNVFNNPSFGSKTEAQSSSPGEKPVPKTEENWGGGCFTMENITIFPETEIIDYNTGQGKAYPVCASMKKNYDGSGFELENDYFASCGIQSGQNFYRKLDFDLIPDKKLLETSGFNPYVGDTKSAIDNLHRVLEKSCEQVGEATEAGNLGGNIIYTRKGTKSKVGDYQDIPYGNCQILWACSPEMDTNKSWPSIQNHSQVTKACNENDLYMKLQDNIKQKNFSSIWNPDYQCSSEDVTNCNNNNKECNFFETSLNKDCCKKGCNTSNNKDLYPSIIKKSKEGTGLICGLEIDLKNGDVNTQNLVSTKIQYNNYDDNIGQGEDSGYGCTQKIDFDNDIQRNSSDSCKYNMDKSVNFPFFEYNPVSKQMESCSLQDCNKPTECQAKNSGGNPFIPCNAGTGNNTGCGRCSDGQGFYSDFCSNQIIYCSYDNLVDSSIRLSKNDINVYKTTTDGYGDTIYTFTNSSQPNINFRQVRQYKNGTYSPVFRQFNKINDKLEYYYVESGETNPGYKEWQSSEDSLNIQGIRWKNKSDSSAEWIELIPEICNNWDSDKCRMIYDPENDKTGSYDSNTTNQVGCTSCGTYSNYHTDYTYYNSRRTGLRECQPCKNTTAQSFPPNYNWTPTYVDSGYTDCKNCPQLPTTQYYDKNRTATDSQGNTFYPNNNKCVAELRQNITPCCVPSCLNKKCGDGQNYANSKCVFYNTQITENTGCFDYSDGDIANNGTDFFKCVSCDVLNKTGTCKFWRKVTQIQPQDSDIQGKKICDFRDPTGNSDVCSNPFAYDTSSACCITTDPDKDNNPMYCAYNTSGNLIYPRGINWYENNVNAKPDSTIDPRYCNVPSSYGVAPSWDDPHKICKNQNHSRTPYYTGRNNSYDDESVQCSSNPWEACSTGGLKGSNAFGGYSGKQPCNPIGGISPEDETVWDNGCGNEQCNENLEGVKCQANRLDASKECAEGTCFGKGPGGVGDDGCNFNKGSNIVDASHTSADIGQFCVDTKNKNKDGNNTVYQCVSKSGGGKKWVKSDDQDHHLCRKGSMGYNWRCTGGSWAILADTCPGVDCGGTFKSSGKTVSKNDLDTYRALCIPGQQVGSDRRNEVAMGSVQECKKQYDFGKYNSKGKKDDKGTDRKNACEYKWVNISDMGKPS